MKHPAYLAGSSFYVHQLEQQGCKQSLSCSLKPPRIQLTGVTTFLAEGAVAARKDVTLWKRFMPPLPRLLGGLFAGLLMVHLSIPNQVVSSNTLIFSSIFDLPKGAVYK